jgi:hypothetical protein
MFEVLIIDDQWIEVRTDNGVANVGKNDDGTWTVLKTPNRGTF